MIAYNLIGLMYTRGCPLSCAHCITNSSPTEKASMHYEDALNSVRVIPEFGSTICFTGGEPFLYYRQITRLISEAKTLGLKVSLVSGAGWVRNEAQTRSRIEAIAAAGLDRLCISSDQYHEEFIPPDRAVALARIATSCGIKVNIRGVYSAKHRPEQYRAFFDGVPVEFDEQRVIKLGRAASLHDSHFEFIDKPPGGTCSAVYSPVIEPDGNVYACCGPSHFCKKPSPLLLGNMKEEPLREILRRGLENPLLEAIYYLGPFGLYQLLKDHSSGRNGFRRRSTYTGICELCLDITDDPALVSAIRERLSDADGQRMLAVARLWRQNSVAA